MNLAVYEKEVSVVNNIEWQYEVIEESLWGENIGEYDTYGIQIIDKNKRPPKIVATLHDVAADFSLVRKMAALFTRYQLAPIHLKDAVENALAE